MRNTLALAIILLGSLLIVSAVKNWKFVTTLLVLTGQKPWDTPADGGGGGTITGTPKAAVKDRPGWKSDDLQREPNGDYKRDSDGYMIPKPGALPFDPAQANANKKPGEADYPVSNTSAQRPVYDKPPNGVTVLAGF